MNTLKKVLDTAHEALEKEGIPHALIGETMTRDPKYKRKPMTLDEYWKFLEEYWQLFGPIPPAKPKVVYTNVQL